MRKTFSIILEKILVKYQNIVFITGDLGYNALENVKELGGDRFINAGVAEQNMVGVAAGLASNGFEVFTYSIAPFAVYRCFEQIKIDVCIHELPVYIVGNGGGYGYGIMGATHHAIEDIACLSALPNIDCWIPAFTDDVEFCINKMLLNKKPAYLRLGLDVSYPSHINIDVINLIKSSHEAKITIIVMGPLIYNVLKSTEDIENVDIFTILKIPILEISKNLLESILKTKKVLVIEEHVLRGGLSEHFLSLLSSNNLLDIKFESLYAKGYPSKLYGNQSFHQKESCLDISGIQRKILEIL
jgi:transketolase